MLFRSDDDLNRAPRLANFRPSDAGKVFSGIEAIRKADKAFRDKLNELLDSDDAGEIFKSRNPFSSVGGRFFCEGVLDALGGIIGDVMAEEAEASLKRTSKYIETES